MRFAGQSPLALLYGTSAQKAMGGQVGSCMPWGAPRAAAYGGPPMYDPRVNATSNYGAGSWFGGGGGCAPSGPACNSGSRADRVRYLQSAALMGQVPQIFFGVRATVDPTPGLAAYTCAPSSSVPLLITRFEFEDDIAVFLDVSSFKITRIDMIAGAFPVAGTTFNSRSTAPPIEDPVLPAGPSMTIAGTNNDSNAHTIRGTLRGIDLTPWLGWLDSGLGFNGF